MPSCGFPRTRVFLSSDPLLAWDSRGNLPWNYRYVQKNPQVRHVLTRYVVVASQRALPAVGGTRNLHDAASGPMGRS